MKTGDPYGLPVPTMVARESREKLQEALDLSSEQVKTLLINSFKSSFLKDNKKKEWISKI